MLQIDDDGRLVRVLPLMTDTERGKKKVLVPRVMNMPAQVKRSVDVTANGISLPSLIASGAPDWSKPGGR